MEIGINYGMIFFLAGVPLVNGIPGMQQWFSPAKPGQEDALHTKRLMFHLLQGSGFIKSFSV